MTSLASIESIRHKIVCMLSLSAKYPQNPCSWPLPVYQDLNVGHDLPVKNAIVNLPIKMKGNSKHTSGNLSLLGAQNKDISVALQMSLTKVDCLQSRLALRHILRSI